MTLSGCGLEPDPTPDYRYRLTVEVETPDGLKTGSSVIEVQTNVAGERAITSPGRVSFKLRGEAVAVDLGEGRTLFALLRSDRDGEWAKNLMLRLGPNAPGTGNEQFITKHQTIMANKDLITLPDTLPNQGGLIDWPARPMLVTFGDLSDPTSVAQVDPDDLAASFGEGVTLKRITVQMTDDPVTSGIEQRLGWLPNYRKLYFDGTSTVSEDMTSDDLRAHMTAGSFSTEFAR